MKTTVTKISFDKYDICFSVSRTNPVTAQTPDGPTGLRGGLGRKRSCRKVLYLFPHLAARAYRSAASNGNILLRVRPYRVELWAGDVLCDEEWPVGTFAWPMPCGIHRSR